jgi:hypothetical protein
MLQGMPGTKFPDALLLVPRFPPNREVIQAFLDCGYYFRYVRLLSRLILLYIRHCKEITIYVFPGTVRPQSQFSHSCVCERICIIPRSVYLFSGSRIGRPIVGIYKSLTET